MAFRTAVLDVLPHQGEGLEDVTSDAILMVSGWGGGKTDFVGTKAIQLAGLNHPVPVGVFEPTYPMVRDILVPTLRDLCARASLPYRYNKVDHDFFVRMAGREHHIMLRSTDNPESLKGPNLGAVLMDEAGIHKPDAWRYLPPRARHPLARFRQFVAVGTPEGFGDFYEWAEGPWDEEKRGVRHVIRAKTYDNVFLLPSPEEYVRRKLSHLDDEDLAQYVEGQFIARGARVYRSFDRSQNGAVCDRIGSGRIEVGADFNFHKMTWPQAILRGSDEAHVFGEVTRYDVTTEDMGEALSDDLRKRIRQTDGREVSLEEVRRRTTIHCDPSAKNPSVRAYKSDVETLKAMGYDVRCNYSPIPVKDRVMSVNWRFRVRKMWIDVAACPLLTKALEQQGRDKNGDPEKHQDTRLDMSAETDALGYFVWGHHEWRATLPKGNRVSHDSYV